MTLTDEEKAKAKKQYQSTLSHVRTSKKDATSAPTAKKETGYTVEQLNQKAKQYAADEKRINENRAAAVAVPQNLSKEKFQTAAEKRKQATSNAIASTAIPTLSAKAVSSEAEKKPMVPAAQQRRQAVSNQVYENVLKGEKYLQAPGEDLAKGLINRLRSAGGETVENVARVINDNVSPDSYFGRTSQNVIDRNYAGKIGDIANEQIAAAKENTGVVGDFLIDTADAAANMASQAILSSVVAPGLKGAFAATQGVSSGAQKYADTREAGGSKEEAWQRGIGAGTIAAVTEGLTGIGKVGVSKIPGVNKLVSHLDEFGAKNWLTNVLATGLGEGGEEGLEYALEYASDVIADKMYKGEIETDFDIAELFKNVASGFVMGAGFGAGQRAIVNNIPESNLVLNEEVETPVTPAEPTLPQTENVTPTVENNQQVPFANAADTQENITEEFQTGDGGFGANTVGAAQSNPNSYSYMQNNYDVYPEGENATRVVDVPTSTDGENRVNRFARTEMEAGATPDKLISNFEKAVEQGDFSYNVATDKAAIENAKKRIIKKGYTESVGNFEGLVDGDKRLSKNDLVMGEMLYAQAAQTGDTKTAMRLASALAQEFTKAGQAVQAARILKKLTPEGKLYNAQKIVDRFNDSKNRPANQQDIEIDEELATNLLAAQTEEEIEAAEEAIKQNIADQMVSTKMDKWNAWRYLSMLGNPKTHIRNVMGNAMFVPARVIKNVVKAKIENAYAKSHKDYVKTTTTEKATDAQINAAKENFEKNKKVLMSGGNYRFENEIDQKRKIFENKVRENIRKFNNDKLEAEDMFFLKRAYQDSFAKYLKANNIDPAKASKKQITAAEDYAKNEAWKATYRDTSKIAEAFERFSNTNKVTKLASDALLPFRKTPINILARGIEYSPVELIKVITYDSSKVKKGEMEAQEMIDHIASGLTGTGVVALGAWLASMGLISGGDDEDYKVQNFEELQGKQNYALQIGDYSYTLDWATPISMPLFVGVEAYNALAGKGFDSGNVFNAALDAISKTADPMIGLSMLQNVESILSGNYGGEGSGIGNLIKEAVISYALQAFPTLGSQIAQTIDPVRRNAYYTDKTNEIPDVLEIPLNRILAKIPIASMLLPERVDEWGRTEKQEENVALRIFENFASPGYISKNKSTEVDEMLKQLYADSGNASVLPSNFVKSFKVDGEELNLSSKQYVEAQKEKGQMAYDMLDQLVANKDFKKLSAEDKADIISDIYSYSTVKGKQKVSDYTTDTKWYENMEKAQKEGVSVPTYLIKRNIYTGLETKENRSKNLQMYDQLIADKGTNAKQDVAIMEYVAGVDLKKYKSATTDSEEILNLYEAVSDDIKKEEDLKTLVEKGFSNAEALAKYNVSDGTKKYADGEFKFGNATKQVKKANKLVDKGYDPETIAKAANAVTSLGKYGTNKNFKTYKNMLNAVGINDDKFINAFWNIYVNG